MATTALDGSRAQAESDGGAQLSARQQNRLAREARSSAAAAVGKPGGTKRRRGTGSDGCGGGKDGREDGPPAFLGQVARGSMLDVASNAREALVSLAADLVAQVGKGRECDGVVVVVMEGGSLVSFGRGLRGLFPAQGGFPLRCTWFFGGVSIYTRSAPFEPTTPAQVHTLGAKRLGGERGNRHTTLSILVATLFLFIQQTNYLRRERTRGTAAD